MAELHCEETAAAVVVVVSDVCSNVLFYRDAWSTSLNGKDGDTSEYDTCTRTHSMQ